MPVFAKLYQRKPLVAKHVQQVEMEFHDYFESSTAWDRNDSKRLLSSIDEPDQIPTLILNVP
jgi:hypothetical protein